jgi:CheY-like chemotaxis protein
MRRTETRIKPTIAVIIEDEFLVRLDLATYFRDAGYLVVEAESAEGAMTICHTGNRIDVLITDIRLNGADSGWDVAEAFRALWKNIPVIYTSGNGADRRRSVPNSLFFNKPYLPAEVLNACRQLIAAN